MRLVTPLLVFLSAAIVWAACDGSDVANETTPLDPVFARGGPACDTKVVPVGDYFLDKSTQHVVDELLRDLAAGCATLDRDLTLNAGFSILEAVEANRESGQGDPVDGALVVKEVWNLMQPFVCAGVANCIAPPIGDGGVPESSVVAALDLEGAFGVRSDGDPAVVSYGNSSVPYWGVEPYDPASDWSDVLPDGRALIIGFPDYLADPEGIGEEEPLGTAVPIAYDWTILPWYDEALDEDALSVAICAGSDDKKEKVLHGRAFLEDGRSPAWCPVTYDPLVYETLGSRLTQLASAVIPFWPLELHATALGTSGSGKAREFSPYFGFALYPEGTVTFITQPGDAVQYDPAEFDPEMVICAGDAIAENAGGGDYRCPEGAGIQVHLTTAAGSLLSGQERILMIVTAEDNNGSWQIWGEQEGTRVTADGYGLVYEWDDLKLDKPGAYKLHTYRTNASGCVVDDLGNELGCGDNSIGLAFPASSSEKFSVHP